MLMMVEDNTIPAVEMAGKGILREVFASGTFNIRRSVFFPFFG
jgi:hypothetical protein